MHLRECASESESIFLTAERFDGEWPPHGRKAREKHATRKAALLRMAPCTHVFADGSRELKKQPECRIQNTHGMASRHQLEQAGGMRWRGATERRLHRRRRTALPRIYPYGIRFQPSRR